jgi:hypothetical protein
MYECIYCLKEKEMQKEWHAAIKPQKNEINKNK